MHQHLGDLRQEKQCHDHALNIRIKKLGPEHFDVAESYNNLGAVHRGLGDLQQAKECQDHAYSIRLKNLGPEYVDVRAMQNNLLIVQREREVRRTSTISHRVGCMIF